MSLDDLATREVGRRLPRECAVTYAYRILPPDRAAVLRRAVENKGVRDIEIYRNLLPEMPPGADPVSEFSIRRHRKPEHVCGTA
jgi:hypothetical protein